MNEYYAHKYQNQKELLIDHLHETADLADAYASDFGSGAVGKQLGLLHDVGKHTKNFQKVLDRTLFGINHAIVGAEVYFDRCRYGIIPNRRLALYICMCINCHHSRLHSQELYRVPADFQSRAQMLTDDKEKINALSGKDEWEKILSYVEKENLLIKINKGDYLNINAMRPACKMFYARMLFSCLVDADYTATAGFEKDNYKTESEGEALEPDKRIEELEKYRNKAFAGSMDTPLNRLREQVYQDAGKAKCAPGVYTMTAPTGTGKTLALINFALHQAIQNKQKRIFIVLPYLSIITQNADIYKQIFGEEIVLEDDSQTVYTDRTRLFSDRWTAPVIVTTSVRFFETLFRVKPTDIRRLHQVAKSVIVFDEAQTLPLGILDITMEIMKELADNYGSTILFSTATQPQYQFRRYLAELPFVTSEVIRDHELLFQQFDIVKNTKTVFSMDKIWTYKDLADYFEGEKQILYIFNTVAKSHAMYRQLMETNRQDLAYLSSSLCPAHRRDMLVYITDKLSTGNSIWLVSTQCIEAGVDIDFPCGAREIAPYTSIVQSAGRVNRNGRKDGKLLVFRMEDQGNRGYPDTAYKNEAMITLSMAKKDVISINDPKSVVEYYHTLFTGSSGGEEDKREIVEAVRDEDFEALSEAYHLIDEDGQDMVVVPYIQNLYEETRRRLEENNWSITKDMMKAVHDITVTVKLKEEMKLYCRQLRMSTHQGVELTNWYLLEEQSMYSPKLGFVQTTEIGAAFFV